jgi:glycosyltransferase involved in cell wall biosynthesis
VTKFVKKKPSSDEFVKLVEDYRDSGGSIVVIDDFMTQIDQDMVDIVTVQSRHYNTSTFILFQSLFPPNKLARQISLNVKYLHIHKNPRENSQILVLARQLSPKNNKWIVEAYHEITKEPHQCLLIDLTQQREEKLRYRSHYLPREFPMKVWLPEGTGML